MSEQNETEPAAPLPTDNLEQYILYGRRQIRQLLQELIDGHALISAHLSPGNQSFLTALITLSGDENWIFLDISPDRVINQRALQAEHLACVTQLEKIRIQFSVSELTEVQVEGRPAFAAPVPDQILRLQRREFFRLHVPLSHGLVCRFQPDPEQPLVEPLEARVIDISAGGLALQFPAGSAGFTIGEVLEDCRLKLPEGDPLSVRLEVRNISRQTGRTGIETLRVGFRFVALPRGADTQIQRYIFRTERERSALERGGL